METETGENEAEENDNDHDEIVNASKTEEDSKPKQKKDEKQVAVIVRRTCSLRKRCIVCGTFEILYILFVTVIELSVEGSGHMSSVKSRFVDTDHSRRGVKQPKNLEKAPKHSYEFMAMENGGFYHTHFVIPIRFLIIVLSMGCGILLLKGACSRFRKCCIFHTVLAPIVAILSILRGTFESLNDPLPSDITAFILVGLLDFSLYICFAVTSGKYARHIRIEKKLVQKRQAEKRQRQLQLKQQQLKENQTDKNQKVEKVHHTDNAHHDNDDEINQTTTMIDSPNFYRIGDIPTETVEIKDDKSISITEIVDNGVEN